MYLNRRKAGGTESAVDIIPNGKRRTCEDVLFLRVEFAATTETHGNRLASSKNQTLAYVLAPESGLGMHLGWNIT